MLSGGLLRKLILSLALGAVVVVALGAIGDFHKTIEVIRQFGWQYLPAAVGLTILNYLLRFVKWHYYLKVVGVRNISITGSALIFFSAFAMVVTPGKVGEWLKSYLLRETTGTPISVSAPIVIAERLTDGLAMVVLALAGLLLYGYAWQVIIAALVPAIVIVVLSQQTRLAVFAAAVASRFRFIERRMHHFHSFYASSRQLFGVRALLVAVAIGVISWSGESLAFYLVMLGLGFPPSFELLVQVTFVLAVSTLAGAVALTPGGLAVAEGSIAGLLLLLQVTPEPSVAAAATFLIRFCTLWLGVALGVAVLAIAAQRLAALSIAQNREQISIRH